MAENPNAVFRSVIKRISETAPGVSEGQLEALASEFREAFLRFGSRSDDNTGCMEEIGVGRTDDGTCSKRPTIGYVFSKLNVDISDVLNAAEGCDVPHQLKKEYPEISQSQWDAALRMATMFFIALQGEPVLK